MSQRSVLAAQKAKCILGCIERSMATWLTEVILPLHSCETHLEYCGQLWGPQHKELFKQVQGRATKII